ncbi:MAG: DNA adenine methylase [Devosiaceae bacterium]|nr:DNA adenine methylase [Devosiaceae bacterium]
MRFIGNKENLLDIIYFELSSRNISGETFFDFFSGTSNVGKFFKKKGYQVFSSDILYFSYVLQRAYIENSESVNFDRLIRKYKISNPNTLFSTPLGLVIEYLNNIEPINGFIYKNYSPLGTATLDIPRMYFSDENARKIDAIRERIEFWKEENLITQNEYYILIACLIETVPFYANISGVYAAFHKKWDPRAKKKLVLRSIELVLSDKSHKSFNCNSIDLIDDIVADIVYLDPPYNQRQYAPNYHLLETIAKYDSPEIRGVTGMRNYDNQKSNFCNSTKALKDLDKIASEAKYRYLVLSYNSEGIMSQEDILAIFQRYGNVELVEFDYRRYKSNSNGLSKTKKTIQEQLYILEKCHG